MKLRQTFPMSTKRAGAHTVEFALVLPVFVIFIFGLVEIGRGMMASTLLTNAARAGCRTGTLPGKATADATAAVDDLLKSGGITGYTTTVSLKNDATKNVSAGEIGDTVTVLITVPASKVSWIPGAGYLVGNISGTFSLPHE